MVSPPPPPATPFLRACGPGYILQLGITIVSLQHWGLQLVTVAFQLGTVITIRYHWSRAFAVDAFPDFKHIGWYEYIINTWMGIAVDIICKHTFFSSHFDKQRTLLLRSQTFFDCHIWRHPNTLPFTQYSRERFQNKCKWRPFFLAPDEH